MKQPMVNIGLVVVAGATLIAGCKARRVDSGLRDANFYNAAQGISCEAFQKGDKVYVTKCPAEATAVRVEAKPDFVTDEEWKSLSKAEFLTRADCPATAGNILAELSFADYAVAQKHYFGTEHVEGVTTKLAELNRLLVIKTKALAGLMNSQRANPKVDFSGQINAVEKQAIGLIIATEELNIYLKKAEESGKQTDLITKLLRHSSSERLYYPDPLVGVMLRPLLKDKLDVCIDPPAAQKRYQAEADALAAYAAAFPDDLAFKIANAKLDVSNCVQDPNGGPKRVLKFLDGSTRRGYLYSSQQKCEAAVAAQSNGVVCLETEKHAIFYRPVNALNGAFLPGSYGTLESRGRGYDTCKSVMLSMSTYFVCDEQNGLYRRSDNNLVKAFGTLDACKAEMNTLTAAEVSKRINTAQSTAGTPATPNINGVPNTNTSAANMPVGGQVTDLPERQPVDSALAVDAVVDSMRAAANNFKVDAATVGACLKATPASWSDIMAYYYCQFPISEPNGSYSVRACFTGSLRGTNPYKPISDYRAVYKFCSDPSDPARTEFAWLRANPKEAEVFQYIMMSQREIAAPTWRFTGASQLQAIQKFYGNNPIPPR